MIDVLLFCSIGVIALKSAKRLSTQYVVMGDSHQHFDCCIWAMAFSLLTLWWNLSSSGSPQDFWAVCCFFRP